jgi:hypothetical protein
MTNVRPLYLRYNSNYLLERRRSERIDNRFSRDNAKYKQNNITEVIDNFRKKEENVNRLKNRL